MARTLRKDARVAGLSVAEFVRRLLEKVAA
jgi:hypothetical protein